MGGFVDEKVFGAQIRESANDGSDFSNPATDYRILFLGEDGLIHVKDSAGTVTNPYSSGGGTTSNFVCQGRLTGTTAVPVTTTDVAAFTTLYFTPFRGNQIATYSGSAWSVNTFTEKSITMVGLTADSNYDVFIVDSTLALEVLIWTNATTRATALVMQDGVLVKSGATTRRYLGTIRINAAGGACEDTLAKRYVFNYYNQLRRMLRVVDTTDSWTYAVAAWRQARATAGNKVEYVCGISEDLVEASVLGAHIASGGNAGAVGIGVDATNANSAQLLHESYGASTNHELMMRADYKGYPGIGYHYLAWLEYARAATVSFICDDGVADAQSGLLATVVG